MNYILDAALNSGAFWQMSRAEKAAVRWLIGQMGDRSVAVEVGAYCGGFLRLLDQHFSVVYSLDLNHAHVRREDYRRVEWVTGDSRDALPRTLAGLADDRINLVLIDGDHSEEAVARDIAAVLQHRPNGTLWLLMHDSWMPEVRRAISSADWTANPHVREVELDFVAGDMGHGGLVGGLAVAVLTSVPRSGDLVVSRSHERLYRACGGT